MKKILGLDLGTTSIGWALINVDDNNNPVDIQGMGVRRVPLSENEGDKFTKGQDITVNADRTRARGARRNYDRYLLRRQALTEKMRILNMLPDECLIKLPMMELWQLRADAVTKKVSLNELGRILYHLNQKRGYKHSRTDANDSKQREYVKEINNRYAKLQESGMTIGQFFARKLEETAIVQDGKVFYNYRIKEQIYPRKAYEEEYDGNSLSIVLTDNLESLSITITYNNEYVSYENVIVKICECAYVVNDLINDGTSIEGISYIYVNNTDSSAVDSNNNILEGVLDEESGYMKYQYSGAYVYTTVKNMIQV